MLSSISPSSKSPNLGVVLRTPTQTLKKSSWFPFLAKAPRRRNKILSLGQSGKRLSFQYDLLFAAVITWPFC